MGGGGGVGLGWILEKYLEVGKVLTYLPGGSGVLLVVVVVVAKQQRTQRLVGSGNCTDSGSLDVMFPAPSVRRHGAGVPVVKFSHFEVVWAVGAFIKESFISLKWEQMC